MLFARRKLFTHPVAYLLVWVCVILATPPSVTCLGINPTLPRPPLTSTPPATTFIVTNKNNDGPGSLRQAILDANSNPGTDTISFNIPGQGVQTIAPSFALPTITDPVIIDGDTQPGFSGTPIIELNGRGGNFDALTITAGNSTVRGLVINRFQRGIYLRNSGGNTVSGNFIGTDSTGAAALPNVVGISIASPDNTIGGTAAGERNVISGNDTSISISGTDATGNRVLGNYIGTNANGTARPSGFVTGLFGIRISVAANNFIGGAGRGEGNVISGHANEGIRIEGGTGNLVSGNFIGTGADGNLPLGNLIGVKILGSTNNVIGGGASGAGNIIGYNFVGVSVECNPQCSVGNAIPGNSIFSNTSLGIDLGGDRTVSRNDAADADAGANNLQNYPLLTSAAVNADGTTIAGTLNSTANTIFRIEFFANSTCDPSGHGEGTLYFGSTTTATDASGNASFSAGFPGALPAGQVITATATDPSGNTSEFSACAGSGSSGSVGFSTFNHYVFEDEGSAIITVNRQGGSTGTLSVEYATGDRTATAGQDYAATAGTLTFADGETTKTFIIPILTDNIDESTEDVLLTLSRASGAPADSVSPSNRAVLSIKDSGLLPVLSIDCGSVGEICLPVSVSEGNAGATNALFTVRLSGDARGRTVSVDFETSGVTATGGTDFQPSAGSLIFPPGVTTQTISVPVNGDTLDEPDETFKVVLKNPNNATISSDSRGGDGVILDDDQPPGVSVDDVEVTEGDMGVKTATVSVKLSGASGRNITLAFATSDNTATAGNDYTAVSGSLTFNPGEVTKTITIAVNGDSAAEPAETFFVNLTDPSHATRARGTVTILDDDLPLLLTEEDSERAIALESVTMTRAPFSTEIPSHSTAADRRTRIMLFARNVELQPGEGFDVVEAHAEDSPGRIYPLTVEFVGKVSGFNWLTQINVRLADELTGVGEVRARISLRGVISNQVIITLKTPRDDRE